MASKALPVCTLLLMLKFVCRLLYYTVRVDKLSVKDQISALGFAGHALLYHKYSTLLHSMKAAIDNMLMNMMAVFQ